MGLLPKTKEDRSPSGSAIDQAFANVVNGKLEDVTEKLEKVTRNYVEPSKPWPRPNVIAAPPWLVARMEAIRKLPPPTEEEVKTQMESSAKLTRQLDRGLTQEEAKQFALDHSDDILAHLNAPWRKKIGENQYEGSCGCVFDAEGNRVKWCGDHY